MPIVTVLATGTQIFCNRFKLVPLNDNKLEYIQRSKENSQIVGPREEK